MKYENVSRPPVDSMLLDDQDDSQPSPSPPIQQNKILENKLIQKYRWSLIVLLCLLLICVIILIAVITHKKECPYTFNSPILMPPPKCNYMGGTSTNNSVLDNGCEHFTRVDDWDHPHNDMLETVVDAYETCCAMCWHQISCMAFAYSPTYKSCWIKTKIREDGGHFALDRISGHLGDCVEDKRQDNWDYPDNNMFEHGMNGSLPASNWQTCCGLCLHQTSCKAYTFSPSIHRCWLKTKAGNGSFHLDRISGKRG